MRKICFLLLFSSLVMSLLSQDDEYRKYLESLRKEQTDFQKDANAETQKLNEEYSDYKAKANAEFADFIAKEWRLFEEFKVQELSMTTPKIDSVPVADKTGVSDAKSNDVKYRNSEVLPQVADIKNVNDGYGENFTPRADNYVVRKILADDGVKIITTTADFSSFIKNNVVTGNDVTINFYGKKLEFEINDKLCLKVKGVRESDVADYFKEMAKMRNETAALWKQVDAYVKTMGLNEWGYFCIMRDLSENLIDDIDSRVLFNFYMLRNEGGFKVKTARGKESERLVLLAAIDNDKEVYSYTFFRFDENDGKQVKYYLIYGGGQSQESIYTYDFAEQEKDLRQIGLDFMQTLNMGSCDVKRELSFDKIGVKIELPYNSAHIAYLDDVPMTIFPIYFASPISIEAQQIFNSKLNELRQQYSPVQFIDIILNFVQTAFEYKTDEQQFGYEKYFYPEEVIAYPYSDCEDRSALFAWIVSTYTDAHVIGLQYEGHLATAVCFGDDTDVTGDMFSYKGKKYFVCDPTYINASIGMTMPQFKDKMPKIIKM